MNIVILTSHHKIRNTINIYLEQFIDTLDINDNMCSTLLTVSCTENTKIYVDIFNL